MNIDLRFEMASTGLWKTVLSIKIPLNFRISSPLETGMFPSPRGCFRLPGSQKISSRWVMIKKGSMLKLKINFLDSSGTKMATSSKTSF